MLIFVYSKYNKLLQIKEHFLQEKIGIMYVDLHYKRHSPEFNECLFVLSAYLYLTTRTS